MLTSLINWAIKADVNQNFATHLSNPKEFGINVKADFILAFWMIHEVPNQSQFLENLKELMKNKIDPQDETLPNASLLISKPIFHVTNSMLEQTIEKAIKIGFKVMDRPKISLSRSVLLTVQ